MPLAALRPKEEFAVQTNAFPMLEYFHDYKQGYGKLCFALFFFLIILGICHLFLQQLLFLFFNMMPLRLNMDQTTGFGTGFC
jgi:hypothetical protein